MSAMRLMIGVVMASVLLIGPTVVAAEKSPALVTPPEPDLLTRFREASMAGVDEVVFAQRKSVADGHWYANFGYYAFDTEQLLYAEGGKLSKLNLDSGQVTSLLEDEKGAFRDPQVHYDAGKILFSYRPGGTKYYHLHEINVDGSGLRQLTDGEYDDIEPSYLPDGDIVFVSSRCKRWVQCWLTKVAVMHRCGPDGQDIRPISANLEHDNTPWPLPDGRLIYQRWEYVDRSQVDYHHLWTANPDGTSQMIYFGNMHPGTVMIDAKPIPGTKKVVAGFSPGHGRRDHDGVVTVVDPSGGPDDKTFATAVSKSSDYRDPWAFSETAFLAAQAKRIVLMDELGRTQTLYQLPDEDIKAGLQCHEPRPVVARPRERDIPSRTRLSQTTGRLVLADVYKGRNMQGIGRGDIKKLMVIETLPKPINFTGGMDPLTYGGSFTLERVMGTVPVEEDGSAYIEVPAMRAVFLVALDENDMAVKRMQSFLSLQPGETTGCVGCHEQRTQSFLPNQNLMAMGRPPSKIEPVADCPDILDFPRDVQPVLDKLCVGCHGYEKTEQGGPYAGNVVLTGDHGPMFSHAYFTMTVRQLFADGRDKAVSNYAPRTIGSGASRILKMLDGSHYEVQATDHEKKVLRLWIEVGAPYPGTYAALGCGSIGGYQRNQLVNTDLDWPTTKAGADVIAKRCDACHKGNDILPKSMSDERGLSFWRFDVNDPRLKLSRHVVFNLSRPDKSLLLLAPLSKEAGGLGLCRDAEGNSNTVFPNTDDAGYKTLLAMVAAGKENLEKIKRFDMPGFKPRPQYIREMRNYGVLPCDHPDDAPVDVYALDRAYWESLWHREMSLDKKSADAGK
jgi:hydrazine synthase alpha subunit-like protein